MNDAKHSCIGTENLGWSGSLDWKDLDLNPLLPPLYHTSSQSLLDKVYCTSRIAVMLGFISAGPFDILELLLSLPGTSAFFLVSQPLLNF